MSYPCTILNLSLRFAPCNSDVRNIRMTLSITCAHILITSVQHNRKCQALSPQFEIANRISHVVQVAV